MSSPDVFLPASPRRHLLSPKSIRRSLGKGTAQSCHSSFGNTITSTPSGVKRPANDENYEPTRTLASPHKRTKSVLGNSTNTFTWDDKVRFAADEDKTRFVMMDKKWSSSTTSSAKSSVKASSDSLLRTPTTPKRSYNDTFEMSRPRVSSPLKKPLSRGSPTRLSPPRSRKRNFSRIDPPSSLRSSSGCSSIDEILRLSPSPWTFDHGYSLSSDESETGGVPLIVTGLDRDYVMPDAWNFTIYEDTPEETLQNLMEHSTGTLDISDDSDDDLRMDEILQKGKENIPPARLQELHSTNSNRESSMNGVRPTSSNNKRRGTMGTSGKIVKAGKIVKGNREVLGGLRVEDFYPTEERLTAAKKFVPVVKKTEFDGSLKSDRKPESPFQIWESESSKEDSGDESEDGGVRLRSRACSPVSDDSRAL